MDHYGQGGPGWSKQVLPWPSMAALGAQLFKTGTRVQNCTEVAVKLQERSQQILCHQALPSHWLDPRNLRSETVMML